MGTSNDDRGIWPPFTSLKNASFAGTAARGDGAYLVLEDGRRILDGISSWWTTLHGHCEPQIADAVARQAARLEHVIFADFRHEPALRLCRELAARLPETLGRFFFSDNGSTSVEVALKMALQYWTNRGIAGRERFVSFEGAYHGDTFGAMAVSGRSVFTRPFENHFFGVDFVPFPATWDDDPDRDEKERRALAALDETLDRNNGRHAALIIEPLIQGAGGMRMCSTGFLQKAVDKAREHDLLVIFDEVMTGFGRTGEWFACVKTGTVPDLLCLSKCLTGGFLPLAVTACTESVAEPFLDADPLKTFYHGHSYTANPLGCAAALASIDLLSRNESRFREIERRHRKRLRRFEKDPRVEKLRACGNVAAMDVAVEGNGGYLNRVGPRIKAALLEAGIFLRPLGNVLYLMPPLCIRDEDLDTVYGAIERVLKNL